MILTDIWIFVIFLVTKQLEESHFLFFSFLFLFLFHFLFLSLSLPQTKHILKDPLHHRLRRLLIKYDSALTELPETRLGDASSHGHFA